MKNSILKILALIIVISMSLTVLVGCDNSTADNNSDSNTGEAPIDTPENYFGDVWEGLKSYKAMNRTIFPYDLHNIEGNPIPVQFLTDQGLLYKDGNKLKVNTDYNGNSYQQFRCRAFVDNNTSENDVHLLLQYQSGPLNKNESNPDVYLATWRLKYNLSDEDYATFLSMQNDWRIRLFVQEMDKIYEPEVLSHSIIRHDLLARGSHVRNEHWTEKGFPNIFVDRVDYDNAVLTYGTVSKEGLKYYDLDIRNTKGWESTMHKYGFTVEECEDKIRIETMDTTLGPCLIKFNVHYNTGGYTQQQAQEAFDNTDNIQYLTGVNINQTENTYKYNPDQPPMR